MNEFTAVDWQTLRDTLRGSIAMFEMLLAECGANTVSARVIGAARDRRVAVLAKIEERLATAPGEFARKAREITEPGSAPG